MRLLVTAILSLSMMGASSNVFSSTLDRESLMNLEGGVVDKIKDNVVFGKRDSIRENAIRERALQIGAQYGYIHKVEEIQGVIKEKEEYIDKVYNFPYLMSMSSDSSAEMYLIPPIVKEYSDIKALDHQSNSLTIIENKYVISNPARLVTTPLDWRRYLTFMPEAKEIQVAESLIPETDFERKVWSESINEGWAEGEQVAEREMLSRIEKLVEDYRGIIKFNRLADEGYFTRPKLIETRIPIAGDESELIQNKTVYTIVTESSTNLDDSDWEARVLDNRESMIFPDEYSNIDLRVSTR